MCLACTAFKVAACVHKVSNTKKKKKRKKVFNLSAQLYIKTIIINKRMLYFLNEKYLAIVNQRMNAGFSGI